MPFKKHFNTADEILYLNTPGNGLIPNKTLEWRKSWDEQFFDIKGDQRDKQQEFIQNVKITVSDFFDSNIDSTFLTPNFSFAYSTLIDLLPNHYSYMLIDDEYPSLEYPIISRRLKRFNLRVDENQESSIAEAIDDYNPDVLLLSIVQYISGLKIDLNFIKKLKKSNPGLLIIADGTQYLGTEPFSFKESGLDAIACSGYKWLLSGFGNGFLMISDTLTKRLENLVYEIPRPKSAMWQSKSILSTFFEPGHQDNLSHGTLQQSLLFLKDLGMENIQKHLNETSEKAHILLKERNMVLPIINQRQVLSQVINIQIDPALYPLLLENGVKCFPRGNGIRIGLHLYNDIEDIHSLLNILDRIK